MHRVQRSMMSGRGGGDLPVTHTHLTVGAARTGGRSYKQPRQGGQHQPDGNCADPVRHISVVHTFIPRRTSQCCPNYAPSVPREGTPLVHPHIVTYCLVASLPSAMIQRED